MNASQSQPLGRGESAATSGAEPSALFSPGPWSAHPSEPGQDGKPLFWYVVRGDDPYDPSIANTWPGSVNHQGDALLIAAAPALLANELKNLATMQETVRRLDRYGKSHAELDMAIEQTRAAIAKALGADPKAGA